jgi:hypothetical protein
MQEKNENHNMETHSNVAQTNKKDEPTMSKIKHKQCVFA